MCFWKIVCSSQRDCFPWTGNLFQSPVTSFSTLLYRWNADENLITTGWHEKKKTFISTKRVMYKILLTPICGFSYIRISLCSRHLQSSESLSEKIISLLALKSCAVNELPGAASIFVLGREISRWRFHIHHSEMFLLLLWLLPSNQEWSRSLHSLLKLTPQKKVWSVQVRWMWRLLRVTPVADQLVRKTMSHPKTTHC